jgi:2,3-bisphosphoglycerate-dependent phosphoglycerate mutase
LGDEGWWNRPAEPVKDRIPRARRFLHALVERHGNSQDRVVVVSHGGFYQCFMAVLLDLPLKDGLIIPDGLRFSLNNCAVTRIDFVDVVRLVYANRLEFMPRELIT